MGDRPRRKVAEAGDRRFGKWSFQHRRCWGSCMVGIKEYWMERRMGNVFPSLPSASFLTALALP